MIFSRLRRWRQLFVFRWNRAEFYRDLSEMYRRGEAMLSFLEGELQIAIKTRQKSRAKALRLILARYLSGQEGGRLELLLRGIVPASDSMMLAGVERSEKKADSLIVLAAAVDHQSQMRRLLWQYSITPIIITLICVWLIYVMSGVIHEIDLSTPVYLREQVWSGFNGFAKWIADLANDYGAALLVVLASVTTVLVWSLSRWTGRARLAADKLPVYSLYRDFQAGLLFSSMSMLLSTGGSLRGTIEDLAQRSNQVTRWQLRRVLRALDDAPNNSLEAFGRGLLSPYLYARAMSLQRTSRSFADVLIELGTSEGGRVLARVRRAAIVANIAVVGVVATASAVLGLASITVPGTFAAVMEPANMMAAKQAYDRQHLVVPLPLPTR